ncbi:MAG: ATPase, T2SS/T4P/T4SS family [Actinobacteria bacterium]|nr:ATPase, T2SS/T4P/T4SS family [Actinomycetota bacterium]
MENNQLQSFGPLQKLIEDDSIEEIWINTPNRVFIARAGKSELTNLVLTKEVVHDLIERLLIWGGRRLDVSNPFVDARLPDGSRLHVAIPEVTATHWAVNVRKHLNYVNSLADLLKIGSINKEILEILVSAIDCGFNILVSGGTQAGKTTFLNALISQVSPGERVITIEEVFELKPNLPDWIALQTRNANLEGEGEISLRKLIKESLRMRPSRIIVGEVREAEALDLLIALNSGLPGMATVHANSARGAISKLQLLPLLAGENIAQSFITPTIASCIDLVVQCSLDTTGVRRVVEVAFVTGRSEEGVIEVETLFKWDGTKYVKGLASLANILAKRSL